MFLCFVCMMDIGCQYVIVFHRFSASRALSVPTLYGTHYIPLIGQLEIQIEIESRDTECSKFIHGTAILNFGTISG